MSEPVSTRRIVSLAASAFVVLAAEPLFLVVDTAVVGHLGIQPLAALAAGGAVMSLLALVGASLEYGTTGRAARFFGSGQRTAAVNEGVQASWLALGLGVLAAIAGEILAGALLRLLFGAGPVADLAAGWLRVALIGLPGVLLIQAGNGWLRGVQDTRTPVRVVAVANVLSLIASPLLVFPAGLGLTGSAVANVGAQWIGAGLCLRALTRERVPLGPDRHVLRRQLVVSRDLVIRSVAFQAAFLTAAGVAGRMGDAELAAHQIGMQIWTLVALLLDSFAIAAQALVGAALGGGDADTATATARRVGRFGLAAGVVFAVLLGAGWQLIPDLMTGSAQVRHQAHLLWPVLAGMMPIAGVVFAQDGVLFGAGDNAFMRTITLIAAFAGYMPIALASLWLGWGIAGVWAGLAMFILIRFVGMSVRLRSRRWITVGTL